MLIFVNIIRSACNAVCCILCSYVSAKANVSINEPKFLKSKSSSELVCVIKERSPEI